MEAGCVWLQRGQTLKTLCTDPGYETMRVYYPEHFFFLLICEFLLKLNHCLFGLSFLSEMAATVLYPVRRWLFELCTRRAGKTLNLRRTCDTQKTDEALKLTSSECFICKSVCMG